MPKITNKSGLPLAVVRAVAADPYDRGDCDFSATQLLKPSRMVALEAKYKDLIEEDAADRIWSLMGQLGHLVLERSGIGFVEQRLFATIFAIGGDGVARSFRISGALDLVENTTSADYKFTTVWSVKKGPKPEWIQQLNIGNWLAKENGKQIDKLQIVALYRDWSRLEAVRDWQYPQQQAQLFELPMWKIEDTVDFITRRVESHSKALHGDLPECTAEERWERNSDWAVMKEGNTKATASFDTKEEAEARMAEEVEKNKPGPKSKKEPPKYSVAFRPGESIRCEHYCPVKNFCSQYKQSKQQN
jgi:hypothetical protein